MSFEINGLPPSAGHEPSSKTTIRPAKFLPQSEQPVHISHAASSLQQLMEAYMEKAQVADSIDMDKVNAYRSAIQNGQYQINASSIAQHLLNIEGLF